ncbi:MAG: hypothetical protein Kow00109_14640 [Acidobacteriota bacterium]
MLCAVWLLGPALAQSPQETRSAEEEGAASAESASPELRGAAQLYVSRCSGCHTVGEGPLSGPDLINSTRWPSADLAQAVRRMQRNVGPMSEEEIGLLVDFLKSPEVQTYIAREREEFAKRFAARLEPASAKVGQGLFFGTRPLTNGGLPCSACHRVNGEGGTLGVDLTQVLARMGETPLRSAIEQSSFKIMRAAYRDRPITRQEALHLTAFFQEVGEAAIPEARGSQDRLVLWALPVAALGVFALALAYRGRSEGTRRRLLRSKREGV